MVGESVAIEKSTKFKTKVCFSVHEALQAKQLGQHKEKQFNSISGVS
jgi:hypothetical protein